MAEEIRNNTHFDFDNVGEDCNWEEQKKNFLCLLQRDETVDLETFKKFEKNLVGAIIDIDIYSERESAPDEEKWRLHRTIPYPNEEHRGDFEMRGIGLPQLWDYLVGPDGGFTDEAHIYIADCSLYESLCEWCEDSEDVKIQSQRFGDFLHVKHLLGGREMKVFLSSNEGLYVDEFSCICAKCI